MRPTRFTPVGRRLMVQDLSVPLLHLLKCVCGVEGRDRDIAAVYYGQVFFEWIHAPDGIVAAALFLARRAGADTAWSEACAGAVGGAGVVGEAEDCDVEGLFC